MLPLKCPICKKLSSWKGNPYRPFCSERCKLIDLGAWASGEYRIPGEKVNPVRSSHRALDSVFAKESENCPSPGQATGLSNGVKYERKSESEEKD